MTRRARQSLSGNDDLVQDLDDLDAARVFMAYFEARQAFESAEAFEAAVDNLDLQPVTALSMIDDATRRIMEHEAELIALLRPTY